MSLMEVGKRGLGTYYNEVSLRRSSRKTTTSTTKTAAEVIVEEASDCSVILRDS